MRRQEIIAQLVAARLEKGISQAELARMIGTQRSSICRLESGGQNLTLDMVLKIAAALGKTVSLSLEEQEEMAPSVYSCGYLVYPHRQSGEIRGNPGVPGIL